MRSGDSWRVGRAAAVAMTCALLASCANRPDFCRVERGYEPLPLIADPGAPMAPAASKRSGPKFPLRAVGRVWEAEVKLLVHIAPGGSVGRVDVISETPRGCAFAEKSVEAVEKWEFAGAEPGAYSISVSFDIER